MFSTGWARFAHQFTNYYRNSPLWSPPRTRFREWMFIPFGNSPPIRHKAFSDVENVRQFITQRPMHSCFYSTAYWHKPYELKMADKDWIGADLIFDLDGTLINSGEGIKNALFESFSKAKLKMSINKSQIKIGPPLDLTIRDCNENLNDKQLVEIKNYFIDIYDSESFKVLDIYPNIDKLLDRLSQSNLKIYIGTNKRYLPTMKILGHLNWLKFFSNVYSIDKFSPKFKNKSQMLNQLLINENLFYICK